VVCGLIFTNASSTSEIAVSERRCSTSPPTPPFKETLGQSYVYWTVQHLDSWIKRDQLDVTCFIISLFNAQHVLDVNTSILRSLRHICWVMSWVVLLRFDPQELATYLLSYVMGCIALAQCVSVLRCGLAVVVWYPYAGWSFSLHMDTTPPQPNHNIIHIEPEQYNPWHNSTNKSQAPEDGCINIRNMLSVK